MKKYKDINSWIKEFEKIDAGTWEDSEYYYDETCENCGYKSIDYAKKYKVSLRDFNNLDDYDGFRFGIKNNKLCCELCYKKR